jgi:hypothetical protein
MGATGARIRGTGTAIPRAVGLSMCPMIVGAAAMGVVVTVTVIVEAATVVVATVVVEAATVEGDVSESQRRWLDRIGSLSPSWSIIRSIF